MSAADNLPRTQFGSVIFPSRVTRLDMENRAHLHEYWKSPGGSPEKGGRGIVRLKVRAAFHDRFPAYPSLYPAGMNQMFVYAQQMSTQMFTHPSQGTFPAFIKNWSQEKEARVRSGEEVDLEFWEDQEASFALAAVATPAASSAIAPTSAQLKKDFDRLAASLGVTKNEQSVFDALQNAVTTVLAFKDTTELYGNRYAASVTNMISLCQQVSQLTSMQDVRSWPVIDSLTELWAQGVRTKNDLQSQRVTLKTITVPYTMSATELALMIFGDASRQSDILTLNADVIHDPLRIRAGTFIRYYPTPAAQITAA